MTATNLPSEIRPRHALEPGVVIWDTNRKYTTYWKVPYGGQWRMTARMGDGKYYSRQVEASAGRALTFACPVAGKLEYLILYLYDRNEETPPEVGTPMDIYREAIEGE